MRIFNSILGDEQVLYDDGRELRRERVEELAGRLARYGVTAAHIPRRQARAGGLALLGAGFSPAIEYSLDGVEVPAFAAGGRMVSARAQALIAHPTDEPCFEVRTRYGRSIRVTGHHSVFVEGEDGEAVAKPVAELRIGERIAVARRIEVPERDRRWISMVEVWRWHEHDLWDLAIEHPRLGEIAWEKRFDLFGLLVSERRNRGPNWRNGAWTQIIRMRASNRVPLPAFWRLGVPAPDDARIRLRGAGRRTSFPLNVEITDEVLWLLGLWVAEGSRHESPHNAFLTLSADSELLERAATVIERAFGLHVVRRAGDAKRAASIYVHSTLLLRLMDFLGFDRNRKRIPGWILGLPLSRLKWFIEGYREGDGVHSGAWFENPRKHQFVTVSDELKDDLIVALARFGLVAAVGRYETRIKRKTGDRRYPFWNLTVCNAEPWSPIEWDRGVTQRLNARTQGDIVWASVREIEPIDATPLVYDFSVPELENFWAGTGVMAHNTYGPRMRAHDGRAIPTFLRQALANRPLTVFGDGGQTRSFCYVSDLIRGLIALAESGYHSPVNIGNPDEFTLLELAEVVIEVTGSESEIVHAALPIDDPKQRRPDITLARELLGWSPEVALRDGLARTIASSTRERLLGDEIG